MIYLDYSATTPVNEEVLNSFNKVCRDYIGNPNSLHKLGVDAKRLMDKATEQIANLLRVSSEEVIFTSGASEANNMALVGVIEKYKDRGKHIITTKLEHSSILATVHYLKQKGFKIDYVKINENGLVDLDDLKRLLTKDTVLVSIGQVNSEIGIVQNVDAIGKIIKEYPRCIFHVDGTQAVGKTLLNLENIDLFSFSAHKIYGLKGVGCLIKKKNIELEPIIHGGKSQTIYRSGTPSLALMVSMAKALKLVLDDFDKNNDYVKKLNLKLKKELLDFDVVINSNDNCAYNIINISVLGVKPETLLHALEEKEIYVSTKTACSSDESISLSVYTLTKDEELAKCSIRVSLSYLTSETDIDEFVKVFKEEINKLRSIRG